MAMTSTGDMIYFAADFLLCILALIAATTAVKKKHYIPLAGIIIAFILSLLLYSWIILVVSLGYIIISGIWFKSAKDKAATTAPSTAPVAKAKKAETENNEDKIRCRFCKKLYSAEYNGCPYCKKK